MALLTRAAEAATRIFRPRQKQFGPAAPFMSPIGGSGIPPNWPMNWWQLGYDPLRPSGSAVVYACRQAYAQTISMCSGTHWQSDGDGGRERITTSALSRILRRPNAYQSPADFFLYLTDCLYGEGAAFGLVVRNARFEISEIHLMTPSQCSVSVDANGAIYYQLAGNGVVDRLFADDRQALQRMPARDVLHVRLPNPRNPLEGCAPLEAAMLEVAVSNAMVAQALAYAANQGRPSGVLQTPASFHDKPEAVERLRAKWNEHTQGVNAGGTPILTDGLTWQSAVVNSRDAQLAEMLQVSDQRIATAYRVPLPLLSLMAGTGPQGSTESLMAFWVSTGLGFAANLIEDAFGRVFALGGWPDDYLELDLEALLRANFRDRIEGLARGVQGGIFSPNEARAKEDLPAMPFGDEPRVQAQVVPLSAAQGIPSAPASPTSPSAPTTPPEDGNPDAAASTDAAAKMLTALRASHERHLAA
jgi:HK97 family phage portal protein